MSETVTQVNETTQQIVRSRTCGLKDFYIALVQSNTATAYTAGTPVKLARAIKAKIDEKWTSEKIYSDAESGLDAAGIVIEFNMIDMGIAEEMNKRMDKMMKNFQSGK